MKTIKIAMLGDSMTDTAGVDCRALREELNKKCPERQFELYNYGVGGTRVGYGLWRMHNAYTFFEREFCPLLDLHADIVVVESFAYNNGSDGTFPGGMEHFREMHNTIIRELRESGATVVFAVTVAPDRENFLSSVPNFVHTPKSVLARMADDREMYLKEGVKIAKDNNLLLANVYQATLDAAADGTPLGDFINHDDWIHPSENGHRLTAKILTDLLIENGLFL